MLRFYTKSDRLRKLFDLYKINSFEDYKLHLDNMKIDLINLKNQSLYHLDYNYVEEYIDNLIKNCKGCIYLLSVYDASKEAAIINRFPNKKFILTDVSIKAIKSLESIWDNVEVIETTFSKFTSKPEDLIIPLPLGPM